jgi:hypothetical protein
MPDIPSQGQMANHSGNILEQTILGVFLNKGFELVTRKELTAHPERYGKELLIKNVPYRSIYGHNSKTEFVVVSEHYQLEIRIECKWQQNAGSVDEKLPYLYLNCIEGMPEKTIFIILGGGGFKPGAIAWLKNAVQMGKYQEPGSLKDIRVYSIDDFITWANRKLR